MGLAHLFGGKKRNEDLMVSVLKGDREEVNRLLQHKADPNYVIRAKQSWSTAQSITPLYTALLAPKGPDLHIIQALLDKGANPNRIIKNANPYTTTDPYQSPLFVAVANVARSPDEDTRQRNTDVYCALRVAKADMYCTPSKYEHKGDASFANLDYVEWDMSIDSCLDQQQLRDVWDDLEQTFESVQQKKALKETVGETNRNEPTRRLKI